MDTIKILWADDEIDLLKPQLLFLNKKGYEVVTVTNGYDAIEECEGDPQIDVIFLDESMPGLTGLETLERVKAIRPHLPVVMITKNEAESIMEEALGAQISDFLIKPVNPNQILLTLKKLIDNKRLIQQKTTSDYQQKFREILNQINSKLDNREWAEVYRQIINWEIKLDDSQTENMQEILSMQKSEANKEFSKFVIQRYQHWIADDGQDKAPVMSHTLLRKRIFPELDSTAPNVLVLLDNLRYDQWKIIEPILNELFRIDTEDFFYSILPTSTQYSRNAIFAGMMPSDIEKHFPKWWKNDTDEGGKNLFEQELLDKQISRVFHNPIKFDYFKVTNSAHGKDLTDRALNFLQNDLTVIVYNFIDMMSHSRTEMEVLKELAGDEKAYRSLTRSWFLHSPLWAALQRMADQNVRLFITTDHGTIRVGTPCKVIGDRDTTTNLRYKVGRNLQYDKKDVLAFRNPAEVKLPKPNISSTFIFAKEDKFFLYPNNYNYYNNYYRNTFQHGGISLEEMICPVIRLQSR